MSNIRSIKPPEPDQDIIAEVETLLAEAKDGKLTGLGYVATYVGGGMRPSFVHATRESLFAIHFGLGFLQTALYGETGEAPEDPRDYGAEE